MLLKKTRGSRRLLWLVAAVLLLPTCKGVDLTAPNDSSITISANPLVIGLNGAESTITVILTNPDGSPVPDGTTVYLTTTLGDLPTKGETRSSRLNAKLVSGNQPGTATVTARSGTEDVSATVDVTIGSTLESITLSANPASLPPGGGKVTLTAVAFGANFETLANVPITFSTDAGTLASEGAAIRTNSKGEARDTLTTSSSANVTASSGGGGTDPTTGISATATVAVGENTPPTARISASPTAPQVGEVVNFSAAESVDEDGTIVSYRWDFGDGGTGGGVRTSHVYQSANTFSAVLVVVDDNGAEGSASANISVSLGDAPIASFTFTPTAPSLGGGSGIEVTFDAKSSRDPDGRIVEYRWEWGDGTSSVITGEGEPIAKHTFTSAQNFSVKLTVTDDLGNTGQSTQTVTIKP